MLKPLFRLCFRIQLCIEIGIILFNNSWVSLLIIDFSVVPIFIYSLVFDWSQIIIERLVHSKDPKFCIIVHNSVTIVKMSVASPDLCFDLLFLMVKHGLLLVRSYHILKFLLRVVAMDFLFIAHYLLYCLMAVSLVDGMCSFLDILHALRMMHF
jgi:hypothetical protein